MGDNKVAALANLPHTVRAVAINFKRGLELLELSSRPFTHMYSLQIFADDRYLCMAVIGPDNSVLCWVIHPTLQSVPLSARVTQMGLVELSNEVEKIRRDNQLYIEVHVNQNHPNMQEQRIKINTAHLRTQLQQIFGPFHNHPWHFLLNALHLVTLTARQNGTVEITSPNMNEPHIFDQNVYEHLGNQLVQDVNITYRLQSLRCLAEYGAQIQRPYTILMLTPPFELMVYNAFVFPSNPAFTTNQIFIPIPPQQ
ncbi:hypothetical protein SLEP1_g2438 [Rubroshorea leprosula]|uniref:Uncharacterized protein n=1 Tax=Rubroshorea leprosula TaxID=152421 RepID=A0AAV5HNS0_9ROSI|nr:hypothetical protein SLEP1_g2438 [Rubroshorea leprosula]